MLKSFRIGRRLNRGSRYARKGQVLSIDIEEGVVEAEVQGSRPDPYRVEIRVSTLPEEAWQKVADVLAGQAYYAATLLSGRMPENIEDVFEEAEEPLFPQTGDDLRTDCSCPDWSNPCKHIAAVYYLLGEEFDRDPFLLFRLRGMSREEFMKLVADRGGHPARSGDPSPGPEAQEMDPEPLPLDPEDFWGEDGTGRDVGQAYTPSVQAALPRGLGKFPLWRGTEKLEDALEDIYKAASPTGMRAFLAETGDEDEQ